MLCACGADSCKPFTLPLHLCAFTFFRPHIGFHLYYTIIFGVSAYRNGATAKTNVVRSTSILKRMWPEWVAAKNGMMKRMLRAPTISLLVLSCFRFRYTLHYYIYVITWRPPHSSGETIYLVLLFTLPTHGKLHKYSDTISFAPIFFCLH